MANKNTSKNMEDMLNDVREHESKTAVKTNTTARPIPKGMVVFYGTDQNGKPIEGFMTPAGAKVIKDHIESLGGSITIDEKKTK